MMGRTCVQAPHLDFLILCLWLFSFCIFFYFCHVRFVLLFSHFEFFPFFLPDIDFFYVMRLDDKFFML